MRGDLVIRRVEHERGGIVVEPVGRIINIHRFHEDGVEKAIVHYEYPSNQKPKVAYRKSRDTTSRWQR